MNLCKHVSWFDLSGEDSARFHHNDRMGQINHELFKPDQQYPTIILFLGRKCKDAALRQLYPNNNVGRGHGNKIANLRLDSRTYNSDNPILFADSDPFGLCASRIGAPHCHTERIIPIAWKPPRSQSLIRTMYSRLLSVFSDVVCVFADDFENLNDVANLLLAWIRLRDPSNLPPRIRPRVIIVISDNSHSVTKDVLDLEDLQIALDQEGRSARETIFASVVVMHMSGDHVSPLARHRRLKEVLLKTCDVSRLARIEERVLFSAVHLAGFFSRAMAYVSRSISEPFDFTKAARAERPIGIEHREHLAAFLTLSRSIPVGQEILTSFIASSIIMDAYPPRMHSICSIDSERGQELTLVSEFIPTNMFRTLYREHCAAALIQVFDSETVANAWCQNIEDHIEYLFPAVDLGFETAIQLHQNNARSHSVIWAQVKSNRTCLYCLQRGSEHVLTCGHAICDVCLILFGTRLAEEQSRYEMSMCILCAAKGSVTAKVKPATAGARILSIDGGGIRGVIPLEYLHRLQDMLGSRIRIQDLFDVAFGTSSGKPSSVD